MVNVTYAPCNDLLRPKFKHFEVLNLKPVSKWEELRALMGMAGFLRRFVARFSDIVAPLTGILMLNDPRFAFRKPR